MTESVLRDALLRSPDAPPERTLVDIFRQSVSDAADLPAIDNGAFSLTYEELHEAAAALADRLNESGVGKGDRVGIRLASGTIDLYVAILAVLLAGAAYVPVDVDDPVARIDTVFREADVVAVIVEDLAISQVVSRAQSTVTVGEPSPSDDAWVIFTSGSTGAPKGVAVSHRSAAGFVDAESQLFLQEQPLGPGDRVMAGLSVAFDASCEEMWLAWRYGACLVPAPRSLVKSGADVGPWLLANDITVVSTVPTLVALWPTAALESVRLLILGGEACPANLVSRLDVGGREVWNTYGPTEATVVSCGARLKAGDPVRIGLPLAGWDLAVVDGDGRPVGQGETGELVIGGIGLARYLDPDKDAERYAPMAGLGWDRAYRSGDLVSFDGIGLIFAGRADEQIKLGGRRIELGEIDSALLSAPNVSAAAAAIRMTLAGNSILVGYITVEHGFDRGQVMDHVRRLLPATSVPRLAEVDTLPVRTSGKIDRDALPWPLAEQRATGTDPHDTTTWLHALWYEILGANPDGSDDDFFAAGGGSLTAAQLVARLRDRYVQVTVADVYEHPTIGELAQLLESFAPSVAADRKPVLPVPPKTQIGQLVFLLPMRALGGMRWLTWMAVCLTVVSAVFDFALIPVPPWPVVVVGAMVFLSPPGKMMLAALGVRLILFPVEPGEYPRGGKVHLRLWAAEKLVDELAAASTSSSTWLTWYARLLGSEIGPDVDLHAVPPVTGFLTVGEGAAIEPEVDLSGHWIDGDRVHIGRIHIGSQARVAVRSMVMPGAIVGDSAEVGPGSAVSGTVPAGMYASGAPARVVGPARGPTRSGRAPRASGWTAVYGATALLLGSFPAIAFIVVALPSLAWLLGAPDLYALIVRTFIVLPGSVVGWLVVMAMLIVVTVRLQSSGIERGTHPVHSLTAWRIWSVIRLLDEARTWLFPLYSSLLTPWWLRVLGARVGPNVEASTVLMLPTLTVVNEGAFLADDTMLGMYELGGGWLRVEPVKIGRHAFVGNSGMTAAGRKVPRGGLVAVLSAAPKRGTAKKGSSWIGSPPTQLRRQADPTDQSLTYSPARRLRWARSAFELGRVFAVLTSAFLSAMTTILLVLVIVNFGWFVAVIASGPLLLMMGLLAAAIAVAAKWLLIGEVTKGEHALWSSFVWRNELSDTFVEVVAAAWFCRYVTGTVLLNRWLAALGASIGRGVWCESYWLPEADLVELAEGATVNRGCVVQTHLFHDRILSMDSVRLFPGSTLGPHTVTLPASVMGSHATIGPMSLVMRGEHVPSKTRWIGNPIGPWTDVEPTAVETA